jgi:hypothetical protein
MSKGVDLFILQGMMIPIEARRKEIPMAQKKKYPDVRRRVFSTLNADLHVRCTAIAKAQGHTLSSWIRVLIVREIEAQS